jgi:hypothetical protein
MQTTVFALVLTFCLYFMHTMMIYRGPGALGVKASLWVLPAMPLLGFCWGSSLCWKPFTATYDVNEPCHC